MSILLACPPEVISRIFQSGDFEDVLHLSLACKRLYEIWLSDSGNIIWQVGLNTILSFHEALIAVRSIQIVQEADEKEPRQLPPTINVPSVTGSSRKPNKQELRTLLDLQHFVRCLEYRFLLRQNTESSWGRNTPHLLDDTPELLPIWKENFHRAVYRFLIAGAVLARAYQEPFFKAKEAGFRHFLSNVDTANSFVGAAAGSLELEIEPEELDYLNSFPVYNFMPNAGWEDCFGPFAEWLISDTQTRLSLEKSSKTTSGKDPENGESVDVSTLREVMQLVFLFGSVFEVDGMFEREEPAWSKWRHRDTGDGGCSCAEGPTWPVKDGDVLRLPTENIRNTLIIWLGAYQPQEAIMPANLSDLSTTAVTTPHRYYSILPKRQPNIPYLLSICTTLHCASGRPNSINDHPSAHPPLHLFSFILEKYFGYQFDEIAFDVDITRYSVYEDFIRGGRIFTEKGGWEGMLSTKNSDDVLSYIQRLYN